MESQSHCGPKFSTKGLLHGSKTPEPNLSSMRMYPGRQTPQTTFVGSRPCAASVCWRSCACQIRSHNIHITYLPVLPHGSWPHVGRSCCSVLLLPSAPSVRTPHAPACAHSRKSGPAGRPPAPSYALRVGWRWACSCDRQCVECMCVCASRTRMCLSARARARGPSRDVPFPNTPVPLA